MMKKSHIPKDLCPDLLLLIYHDKVNEFEAERIEDLIDSLFHGFVITQTPSEILQTSQLEYNATGRGVPYKTVANWRYNGWPDKCEICGKKLHVEKYYWQLLEREDGYAFAHLDCFFKHKTNGESDEEDEPLVENGENDGPVIIDRKPEDLSEDEIKKLKEDTYKLVNELKRLVNLEREIRNR